ncbi:MAG: Rieske (2Fe-2S) protein [Actinomycetes bacterium]
MTNNTTDTTDTIASQPNRRTVLSAGGLALAAVAVTTACGSTPAPAIQSPAGGGEASEGQTEGNSEVSAAATPVAAGTNVPTSSVPVGGGVILQDPAVVVTQPTAGTFEAFSAICTHAGCAVGEVTAGQIICPCHGSIYSAVDGSVIQGPAPSPLAPVKFTVSGDNITVG